jgi:hypothetical protein
LLRNILLCAACACTGFISFSVWGQSTPAANAFNPAISLILDGQYRNLERDPSTYKIGGFIPGGDEVGPGKRGFNLGESELLISANIDPYFSGVFIGSISQDNKFSVEEAYVLNTGAAAGLSIKFGRFKSGFGYLNEVHAHAWDFTDAPLLHQAFFGGQLAEEGVQLRWIAPTPYLLEVVGELGRGSNFPGSDLNKNGNGATLISVHLGDDVGDSHSYRGGLSYRRSSAVDRAYQDVDSSGAEVTNAFSGNSTMIAADLVWKWSPHGNTDETNAKFQLEYFRRQEDGTLAFNTSGANLPGGYHSTQSGWYMQGVYQFMPRWRVGLRHDELNAGSIDIGLVDNGTLSATDFPQLASFRPRRDSAMVDFRASEFSQLRVQIARDQARFNESDTQIFVQYTMSIGAHGAHKF